MAGSILAGKKGMIIPAALAVLAVLLSYQYLQKQEQELGFKAEPLPVLVATKDVPRMTRLDESVMEAQKAPRSFIQPGALTDLREAVNQVNLVPILKGEQILGTKLAAFGRETGLAIKVPKGLRGVTVATTDISGVAGLVKPGNYVDVVGTFDFGDRSKSDMKTYTILQDVMVLAVEQNLGAESEAARARTKAQQETDSSGSSGMGGGRHNASQNVTLALAPAQVQDLVLAQEAGRLTLALRSTFEGHGPEKLNPANLKDILGVNDKVIFNQRPPWREIRGTATSGGLVP